ncbi:hypothetical protein V8F06_008591, partial [Rhypophila decipiens]
MTVWFGRSASSRYDTHDYGLFWFSFSHVLLFSVFFSFKFPSSDAVFFSVCLLTGYSLWLSPLSHRFGSAYI